MKNIKPGSFVHAADQHGPGGEFYGILLSFGEVELRDGRVVREAHVLDLSRVDTSQGAHGNYQYAYTSVITAASLHPAQGDQALAERILRDQGYCLASDGSYARTRGRRLSLRPDRYEQD